MSVEHDIVFMQRIVRWSLIPHVEYLLAWPQILFRSPMAIKTELHVQRFSLIYQRHLVDWSVAGVAAHTFIDVNAVIGVHKIRDLIDARPLDRLAATEAFAHRLQQRRVGPDL